MSKKIVAICGSASKNSNNLTILKKIIKFSDSNFDFEIVDNLTELPHFKTELTSENVPEKIIDLRNKINNAAGIIVCTPEYIFSIPSGLKNMIEWCVSTTVFSDKPVGLITASASGIKGHEELQLIMKTVQTNFTKETTLLIQGMKGKISKDGEIKDEKTKNDLENFTSSFDALVTENENYFNR